MTLKGLSGTPSRMSLLEKENYKFLPWVQWCISNDMGTGWDHASPCSRLVWPSFGTRRWERFVCELRAEGFKGESEWPCDWGHLDSGVPSYLDPE